MKLMLSALAVAMSLPVWANEPAAQATAPVATPAPAAAEPAAVAAPAAAAAPIVVPAAPAASAAPTPQALPVELAAPVAALPPEVKEEIILNNPTNLQALQTLLGPELMRAATAPNAPQVANASGGMTRVATAPSAGMAAGRQQVQVRPGETLDRILARTLGATAFAPALVRKTVVDMNPQAFAGGSPHRLNAGATLVLPSLQDLQAVAAGGTPGAATAHGSAGGHALSSDDRRNWIRYP